MSGSEDPAGLRPGTVEDLWRYARELGAIAEKELSPPQLRRALIVLAVAGSGGDAAAFEVEVLGLHRVAGRIAVDPKPPFTAASAIAPEHDPDARAALLRAAELVPDHRSTIPGLFREP